VNWILQAIAAGVTAFFATNIDDILILMVFFSQVSPQFRPWHIVLGQYLGFCVLIVASLPGFLGGQIIPEPWVGLLGIMPIAIGIRQFLYRSKNQELEVQTVASEASVSFLYKLPIIGTLAQLFPAQLYPVSLVTIANGGDNIGIYLPLFASADLSSALVILVVFFLLIGVWCWVAYLLSTHPIIANALTKYGEAIVPLVLIVLGFYILIDSKSYELLSVPSLK
jgi:cadmium resistance transport/sequestration family protein